MTTANVEAILERLDYMSKQIEKIDMVISPLTINCAKHEPLLKDIENQLWRDGNSRIGLLEERASKTDEKFDKVVKWLQWAVGTFSALIAIGLTILKLVLDKGG